MKSRPTDKTTGVSALFEKWINKPYTPQQQNFYMSSPDSHDAEMEMAYKAGFKAAMRIKKRKP